MAKDTTFPALMPDTTTGVPASEGVTAGWRAAASALFDEIEAAIAGGKNIDPASSGSAFFLLLDAEEQIEAGRSVVSDPEAKSGDLLDHIYHAQALLTGLRDMADAPKALRLLMASAVNILDNSSDMFDVGGLADEGISVGDNEAPAKFANNRMETPTACALEQGKVWLSRFARGEEHVPNLSATLSCAEATDLALQLLKAAHVARRKPTANATEIEFMAGKELCADMLAAIEAVEDEDVLGLQACFRGRDVPQQIAVRPFIEVLIDSPHLREGFMAALTSVLCSDDTSNEVRDLTWEECVGGPDTRYSNEVDDPQAHPVNATAQEVRDALTAITSPHPHMAAEIQSAKDAAFTAASGGTLTISDTEAALHQVRKHVYMARTHCLTNEDAPKEQPTLDALLTIHRRLNACLGGHTAEDRPTGDDPLGNLLNRLDSLLQVCEEIDGDERSHELISLSGLDGTVGGSYWDARSAWDRGDEADARRQLQAMTTALQAALGELAAHEPRAVLGRAALAYLDEFLADAPAPAATEESTYSIAIDAGCLISRLADHAMTQVAAGKAVELADLQAIHTAASVVMSSDDDMETAESLEDRLEQAKGEASVIFLGCLPRDSGIVLEGDSASVPIPKDRLARSLGLRADSAPVEAGRD